MVVNPTSIINTTTETEREQLDTLERRIDLVLTNVYNGKNSVWINANIFSGVRLPAVNSLLDKYKGNGWDVQYKTDQRDKDAYVFSATQSSQYDKSQSQLYR